MSEEESQYSQHFTEKQTDKQSILLSKLINGATIHKLQSELRKINHCIHIQKEIQKNKTEYLDTIRMLEQQQNQMKLKRKEILELNLEAIELRRKERLKTHENTQHTLQQIKKRYNQKRKKMESMVKDYKEQYDYVYKKKLQQRRDMVNIVDLDQVDAHQRDFINKIKSRNQRIKTELGSHRNQEENTESRHSNKKRLVHKQQTHAQQLKKKSLLLQKRIQYGNRISKQIGSLKTLSTHKKANQKSEDQFNKMIDQYKLQKQIKKPPLDTNLKTNPSTLKQTQIIKIKKENIPVIQKMKKLNHLSEGYTVRYDSGKDEALDYMLQASLARADIYLHMEK